MKTGFCSADAEQPIADIGHVRLESRLSTENAFFVSLLCLLSRVSPTPTLFHEINFLAAHFLKPALIIKESSLFIS